MDKGRTPKLAVLVLNWNGGRDTVRCLASLAAQKRVDLRLLVLDNGSTDDSVKRIQATARKARWPLATRTLAAARRVAKPPTDKPWHLLRHPENTRYAGGNNAMSELARRWWPTRDVLILNNDVTLPTDALARLAATLAGSPDNVAAVAPTIRNPAGVIQSVGMQVAWLRGGLRNRRHGQTSGDTGLVDVDGVEGAAVLIRAEALDAVGPLDAGYFLYWEDADWCARARAKGWRFLADGDVSVVHGVSGSTGGAGNPHATYCLAANRFRYLAKHAPRPWRFAITAWYLAVPFAATWLLLVLRGNRVQASALARGTWHGLRHHGDARATVS